MNIPETENEYSTQNPNPSEVNSKAPIAFQDKDSSLYQSQFIYISLLNKS